VGEQVLLGADARMIDLHCHVLPAIDDGPETEAAAIALARDAGEDGITAIVATPHVSWTYPEIDAPRIALAVEDLRGRLRRAGVGVEILTGAEVAATRGAELSDQELRALTLGGGDWLLFECPLSVTGATGFATVARSVAWRGHRLLLAHPERSPVFLRNPALLDELIAEGMLTQITAGSLSGRYGRPVREFALAMARNGTAHVIASDAHGEHRPARIAAELADVDLPSELVDWMARQVPAALLAGEPLPGRPHTHSGHGRRRRLGLGRR
jgi:protein-tyrosine phosphatase